MSKNLYLKKEEMDIDYIQGMVDIGIVTDKQRFEEYLINNHLELEVKKVQVKGYGGEISELKITDKDIFSCCGCMSLCIDPHAACETCGENMCYNCIVDGTEYDECMRNDLDERVVHSLTK